MWFQKKQKDLLPELPDSGLPKLPEFEYNEEVLQRKENIPELRIRSVPSAPETQRLIKQEIESPFEREKTELPELFTSERKIVAEPTEVEEEKEIAEKEFEIPRTIEISEKKKPVTKKAESIYVRLDKFKECLELFEDIGDRVSEIEDMLNKIKEIRGKEEKELADWEREIQVIKSRLGLIDNNLFSKFG